MRVLICRSNPVAPDPRVEKIARALAAARYSVQVLGWDRSGQLAQQEEGGGYTLRRLPLVAEYGTGLANLPNLLRWELALLRWLVRYRGSYDIIHACDFDTILPALLAKYLFRKKVVYDIFDFYADHLRATPTAVKRLIRGLDIWAIGKADGLILVDEARWEQVKDARPRHSAVIYNSPSEEARQIAALPEEAAPPAPVALRLAYVGLLQGERGLFQMLSVLQHHPDWRLDLAGFGGDEDAIYQAAGRLPNVAWHGRVSYPRALQLSQAADVLFATYDPAIPNHRYSSPNKVFEAMLLGKPVIVARDTNMDRMIAQAGCGLIVTYGDEAELETALQRLADEPELRARLGQQARRAYQATYSWAEMQARLLRLYSQVTGEAPA